MKHNQPERLSEKTPRKEKMVKYPCDFIKNFCENPQPAYRHELVTQKLINRYAKVCGIQQTCDIHSPERPSENMPIKINITDIDKKNINHALNNYNFSEVILCINKIVKKNYGSINYIAKRSGLSRNQLNNILNGKNNPRFDTFLKILHALELSLICPQLNILIRGDAIV